MLQDEFTEKQNSNCKTKRRRNRFYVPRVFDDLVKRIDISSFFLKMKAAASNNIVPADVMLMAESIIGENWKEDAVKYSMMMDSTDIAIA